MNSPNRVSYDPETYTITYTGDTYIRNIITSQYEYLPNIASTYNLSNDTFQQNFGIPVPLTQLYNAQFMAISKQLVITDTMIVALMKSKYYTDIFLPEKVSIFSNYWAASDIWNGFITPFNIIRALFVPYNNADYIAYLNPKYRVQLTRNN